MATESSAPRHRRPLGRLPDMSTDRLRPGRQARLGALVLFGNPFRFTKESPRSATAARLRCRRTSPGRTFDQRRYSARVTKMTAPDAPPTLHAGFRPSPEWSTDEPMVSKTHQFESVPNFRDLGGYRTRDGRAVAWRQLFRSAALHSMSRPDIARLKEDIRPRASKPASSRMRFSRV